MRIPELVTDDDLREATGSLNLAEKAFDAQFEFFEMTEGKVVQVMHDGPFSGELETMERLQQYADSSGLKDAGTHHEVYLVDWERGQKQDRLHTILRHPVR